MLSAEDLLAGSSAVHTIEVPAAVLRPGDDDAVGGVVQLRPLTVSALTLMARASRDDPALLPLFMVRESLVQPVLTLDQVRGLHVGLVYFLVSQINLISGLTASGDTLDTATASPLGQAHLLLAQHFGWTPEQVSSLTPGQVAVYLAGIEKLMEIRGDGE